MAHIAVLEDSYGDLIERYNSLTEKHDLAVYFKGHNPSSFYARDVRYHGFENVFADAKSLPTDADVYFSDGLGGRCFELLEPFPQQRCVIISSDSMIRDEAQRKGYRISLGEELSEIVDDIISQRQ